MIDQFETDTRSSIADTQYRTFDVQRLIGQGNVMRRIDLELELGKQYKRTSSTYTIPLSRLPFSGSTWITTCPLRMFSLDWLPVLIGMPSVVPVVDSDRC